MLVTVTSNPNVTDRLDKYSIWTLQRMSPFDRERMVAITNRRDIMFPRDFVDIHRTQSELWHMSLGALFDCSVKKNQSSPNGPRIYRSSVKTASTIRLVRMLCTKLIFRLTCLEKDQIDEIYRNDAVRVWNATECIVSKSENMVWSMKPTRQNYCLGTVWLGGVSEKNQAR